MNNAVHTTHDTDKHHLVGLLTGLLFGALAGFGTMLLLAPQSGIRTRFQIDQKSTELHDRTIDTFNELVALSHFDTRKILTGGIHR